MLEPYVESIEFEDYKELLRGKWRFFNDSLEDKHWDIAKQCLMKQSDYLDEGKIQPLKFILGQNHYVFVQINGDKFSSNEEKTQFVKEAKFLRLIDFQLNREEPLNLEQYLAGYQPSSPGVIPLTQLFIIKKK